MHVDVVLYCTHDQRVQPTGTTTFIMLYRSSTLRAGRILPVVLLIELKSGSTFTHLNELETRIKNGVHAASPGALLEQIPLLHGPRPINDEHNMFPHLQERALIY